MLTSILPSSLAGWLPLLTDVALKATIILLAAAAASLALRRAPAADRHLVWSSALAAVLVLPLLAALVPAWTLPVPAAVARLLPDQRPATAVAMDTVWADRDGGAWAEPLLVPKGSELICTAVYDNSEENLNNPDPTRTVTWGEQSWDEMMIGFFNYTIPVASVAEESDRPEERPSSTEPENE